MPRNSLIDLHYLFVDEQACKDFPQASAHDSVVIGDSLSDIEAGRRLGMKTIFIEGEPDRQKAGAQAAASLADEVATSIARSAADAGNCRAGELQRLSVDPDAR